MSAILQLIGAFWAGIGVLAVFAAFGGQGAVVFMGGVGLGIFPGLVLMALGRLSEQLDTLVQRFATEDETSPASIVLDPALPPPTLRAQVRPPWEQPPDA